MFFKYSVILMITTLQLACTTNVHKRSYNGKPPSTSQKEESSDLPDLHNSQFCTDISSWGPIEWTGKTVEKCNTTFTKKQKNQWKKVCDNVTEIACEIVPYTKCKLEMINVDYKGYEDVVRPYTEKVCEHVDKVIQHEKLTPKCFNETKLNCVTIWKEDDKGEKVWAGNEDCEEVTWKRCELVPVLHNFTVPEVKCGDGGIIEWEDCEETNETYMATQLTCEVFHSTDCKPKTTKMCRQIEYTEWFEEPVETCETVTLTMPNQTWEHKEKCLFHENLGGSSFVQSRNHGNSRHNLIPNTKSSRRNRYDNRARRVNKKNNRRGKENIDNTSTINQNKTKTAIPRHPSLDGFELHKNRNGKSASSEKVSMKSSTSELISIKEDKEKPNRGKEILGNVENKLDGRGIKESLKNSA